MTASLVSKGGKLVPDSGNSDALTWEEDRLLLSTLRARSEIVLTTGKTARDEKLRNPKTARLAILTRTQNLSGTEFDRPDEVLLISDADRPSEAIQKLQDLGYVQIQVEFGPNSMKSALSDKRIDLLLLSEQNRKTELDTGSYQQVFMLGLGNGILRGLANGVAI